MNRMGGRMKKITIVVFLFISIFYYTESITKVDIPIKISYGNRLIPFKGEYDFDEITSYGLIISPDKIRFENLDRKDERMKRKDYEKIIEKIYLTLNAEELLECYKIKNYDYLVPIYHEQPLIEVTPINVIIEIDNQKYCMKGKNELLEYLNNKYNLEIKWKITQLKIKGNIEY